MHLYGSRQRDGSIVRLRGKGRKNAQRKIPRANRPSAKVIASLRIL